MFYILYFEMVCIKSVNILGLPQISVLLTNKCNVIMVCFYRHSDKKFSIQHKMKATVLVVIKLNSYNFKLYK